MYLSKNIPQIQKLPSFFPYSLWLEWFFYTFFLGFVALFIWLIYEAFGITGTGLAFLIPATGFGLYFLYQWLSQGLIFFLKNIRGEKFGVWIEEGSLMIRMTAGTARCLHKGDVKTCERKTFLVSQDLPLTQKETITLLHLKSGETLKISDLKIQEGQWLKAAIDQWKST